MRLRDRAALYSLLDKYPHTFSLSAHTHNQENRYVELGENWHHHLVHGTCCGMWWGGPFDETGIPLSPMHDGAPKGYSIISFDKNTYSVEYRAARRPADYQMDVYLPDAISASDAVEVSVNVFGGSKHSRVEMQVDGAEAWTPLEQYTGTAPFLEKLHGRQSAFVEKYAAAKGVSELTDEFIGQVRREFHEVFRGLSKPSDTVHLWKAPLPGGLEPGVHVVTVRTEDMYGHVYMARRAFRVN